MRIDLIPTEALIALGERLYLGATTRAYGLRNWEKGITYENLINHAYVHLAKLSSQVIAPTNDSPFFSPEQEIDSIDTARGNASAVMWNMMAIIYFLTAGNPAEKKE
jgi:hypothetical protein